MLKSYLPYRFNPETKMLRLERSITTDFAIRVLMAEDEQYLYESKFLRMLVEMRCWRMWSTITSGKFDSLYR